MKLQQLNAYKIYLRIEDPFESKYQLLTKEKLGIKKFMHPKHLLIFQKQLMMFLKI